MTERRARWLLFALLVSQFLLLSAQIPEPGARTSRLEAAVLRIVAPFAHLVSSLSDGAAAASAGLARRGELIEENRRLKEEVEILRRRQAELHGIEESLRRLSAVLEYTPPPGRTLRVADIVYIDHASWLQTLMLYVGAAPVRPNQPVVSSEGLVGRVIVVPAPYAKVQLITDRAASVGAMIQRTRRQGVVRGASGGALEMSFVPLQADVQVGDLVVTAGIDGVYPLGIPVGTVTEVSPGNELFHRIRLVPRVDFGVLDQVYVLQRDPVPETAREALPDG